MEDSKNYTVDSASHILQRAFSMLGQQDEMQEEGG